MLKNPCDRIAAKLVAEAIVDMLREPDEASMDGHPLAPVVQIMQLHKKDVQRVKDRLRTIAVRLNIDADLPERIIDWRKTIEGSD